jgi:hypothetical protein
MTFGPVVDERCPRRSVRQGGQDVEHDLLGLLLDGTPYVISWGWFQITLANLVVVVLMIITFVLALLLPFPKDRS